MPELDEKQARTWGMLCHLIALAGFVFPFGHILGPVVIWMIKKDESPFVNDQGKESLNFQISVTIYGIVCGVLALVAVGILLALALMVFDIVMVILAAVRANKGESHRYPLCIRFIK
jgi:uncharacterized Tic20 family protein